MNMTRKIADAIIEHIEELSREDQTDSLRKVILSFKKSNEKTEVLKKLRERKKDISDMAYGRREMP